MKKFDLNNFFGFCYVKVECPQNIKNTLLPYKNEFGEMSFPTGT
jgi:hypothetical protein